jgi:uncharacterized protein YbjT (DUF2867 family)
MGGQDVAAMLRMPAAGDNDEAPDGLLLHAARGKTRMDSPESRRCAVVAGATGLVGAELLARLLQTPDYGRIVALARRPLGARDPRLAVAEAAFDRLPSVLRDAVGHGRPPDVFCCLGSTLKAAGSKSAFRQVDHDHVLALGRWACSVGARRMLVVSALGADAGSRVFYNRVKGETERDLAALGLASLVLLRPSLLVGRRAEFRLGERIALIAARPLHRWLPAAVRPVAAADVAQAMIDAALAEAPPPVIASAAMHGAARRRRF